MAQGMQQMGINPNWARFDFSNGSPFTGKARGGGFAGKLGVLYQATPELSVGATYHSKTFMNDLKTNDASLSMDTNSPMGVAAVNGSIRLKDFQWPATWGLGLAYKMNDWLFAADVKRIEWSGVMDAFNMGFTASADPMNGPFANASLDAKLYQNWDDQNVFSFGASYRYNTAMTLRAGFSIANNPIPDDYLNFLFPATIKTHINFGLGYAIDKTQGVDFALVFSPEVEQTNSANGITTTHSQYAWEVMYSKRF
jgi:long-chain fatty acid transport protein